MEEYTMLLPLPIILGRPFMRTEDTKICVKNGTISMKVNEEKIEFKIFNTLKLPQDDLDCFSVCLIHGAVKKIFQAHHIDPLEATLTHSFSWQDTEPDFEDVIDVIIKTVHFLEAFAPHPSKYKTPFDTLIRNITTRVPSIIQAPILGLKQLPTHLKYAYLGAN
jgi:hypothetical protein